MLAERIQLYCMRFLIFLIFFLFRPLQFLIDPFIITVHSIAGQLQMRFALTYCSDSVSGYPNCFLSEYRQQTVCILFAIIWT